MLIDTGKVVVEYAFYYSEPIVSFIYHNYYYEFIISYKIFQVLYYY